RMAVKNVECQLAEVQIGRLISGDVFSTEARAQLEKHLAKCPECTRVLRERRVALKSMLNHGFAAVTTEAETKPPSVEDRLLKAIWEKPTPASKKAPRQAVVESDEPFPAGSKRTLRERLTPQKPGGLNKPLTYAAILAVVLIGMNYVSK